MYGAYDHHVEHVFTDPVHPTQNGYNGYIESFNGKLRDAYSRRYIAHPSVQPFRNVFMTYELLAYLSVRACQLGISACEVPTKREYPHGEVIPTKIDPIKGNLELLKILHRNMRGDYHS